MEHLYTNHFYNPLPKHPEHPHELRKNQSINKMWLLFLSLLVPLGSAQAPGSQLANYLLPLPVTINGVSQSTSTIIDANWRWIHNVGGYTNCFNESGWNPTFCPDPVSCTKNCQLEGVTQAQYTNTYGVTTSGSALTLNYVTGTNVGSRMYLLDPTGKKYQIFTLLNRQFVFTVDASQLVCGLNGALYFVNMAADGGLNTLNSAGAPFGTGYGDAQCPTDIKFINGFSNTNKTGVCSPEVDIWEANSICTQLTPHTCAKNGVWPCTTDCASQCDQAGADLNPYRLGLTSFYGPSKQIDTTKPVTVITQFITSDGTDTGDLVMIKRLYQQNGLTIDGGNLTDAIIAQHKAQFNETNVYAKFGGLKATGKTLQQGMVLVMSLWDDTFAHMLWLDSVYPVGASGPGAVRGPCATTSGDPATLRASNPSARVVYSNIQVSAIGSSPSPSPVPTPTPMPTPVPTPPPSQCSPLYGQCGGTNWNGPTCCSQGICTFNNQWYSQCLNPSPTPSPVPTPTPTPVPTPTPTPTPNPTPTPTPINGYWKCTTCTPN